MFMGLIVVNTVTVQELDYNDNIARQHFDILFGFEESSLDDIPVKDGVRRFVDQDGDLVVCGNNLANVACVLQENVDEIYGK